MTQGRSATRHAAPGQSFDSYADFYRGSAYSAFPQEHRAGGSLGLGLLSTDQEPIDLIDAAVPDLVMILTRTTLDEVALDAGDGLRLHRGLPANTITVTPPMTEERFKVTQPHGLTVASLPRATATALLDAHGLGPEAWAPFVTEMRPRADIARTITDLWARAAGDTPADGLRMDALTLQLLAQIWDDPALSPMGAAAPDARIARAVDYAEAHLGRDLSVGELAGIAAMSPAHFARSFRATTGEAVWAFVQRRRAERARDLLLTTGESLAEIAYLCGYSSQAHMTTALRLRFDATPGAIRGAGR